jgi:hypothetical protein
MGGVINRQQMRGVNLGVALRRRERGMPQQFLDRAEIPAAGQQVRGE